MIRKSAQFEQAVELRKRGFTYDEIAKIVGISKSTVSSWISRETWSVAIKSDNQKRAAKGNKKRISLLNKARGNQNKKLYAEAERSAKTEFKHYTHNPLFIAGVALYMADGDRKDEHLIRIAGGRKDVHRIFIKFAQEYLGVPREKIRFWLSLDLDSSPEKTSKAWSKALRIPLSQFHKYQVVGGRTKKRTLHDGVGNTIIGSKIYKKKLMKWIDMLYKDL
jgi:predicted transcriptional regulator/DNA-binding transcriptional MerR regulator